MSKSVKRVVKNSFFQTAGAFTNSILNFVLTLGYARFLGPAIYGALVTSQAQVLVWTLLVDLGLSNSLISALTSAESGRQGERQTFRARDLLFRVLFLRLAGATLGTMATFFIAWLRFRQGGAGFWQEVAFTPYLYALALSQTGVAFAAYRHKQGLSVIAMLAGVALTTAITLALAWHGTRISYLLLSQSWGGFLAAAIVFGYFSLEFARQRKEGATRRLERMQFRRRPRGPWGAEAWAALTRDAWPYAVAFAVFVLWQRLDQIAATHIFGDAAGGQYGLAVRLVSVPILVATSISFAIFPDLQRVGRDAPHRVRLILGAVSKTIYRYGILVAFAMVCGIAVIIVPFVPKFRPAIWLLPHFLPGIWAFWMQSFIVNALFGLRAYRETAKVHLVSLFIYVIVVFTLPRLVGLPGVVWANNIFCLSMAWFGYRAARRVGLYAPAYVLHGAYSTEEQELLSRSGLRFFRRPGEPA